jgi:hypothetical protein
MLAVAALHKAFPRKHRQHRASANALSAAIACVADVHSSAPVEPLTPYCRSMTDTFQATTKADAQFVHDEWDRRTRAHDIDGLLDLYLADAVLESPLVPRVLDQSSGVLHGHDELRRFFVLGTAGRPNDLVRWYRTGQYMFNGHTLIWEYPGKLPNGNRSTWSRSWSWLARASPGTASTGAGTEHLCSSAPLVRALAEPGTTGRVTPGGRAGPHGVSARAGSRVLFVLVFKPLKGMVRGR